MPKPKELNESTVLMVQWLNEAHAKEAELEADLTAHISLTEKASYKKRLEEHLRETREHKRAVARRITQLGGETSASSLPGVVGGAATIVTEAAGKAVAAVKGQLGAARAIVTEQAQTHLRNAQDELREEHVEIALYSRIETLAEQIGDRDTAQLARQVRRDEERMAKFLTAELQRLVKDVVRAEIPRDQQAPRTSRRRAGVAATASSARRAAGSAGARSSRSTSRGRATRSADARQ